MKSQMVLNATSLEQTEVQWGDYRPLFETDYQKIMQVHFWSPLINRWVKLVPAKTGDQSAAEVTPEDLVAIRQFMQSGCDQRVAIERVLGKVG